MIYYYILDGKKPVRASLIKWARMMEDVQSRTVARDHVGDMLVSTVFLGYDAGHGLSPQFFETMIFSADGKGLYCDRYPSWEEAEEGHLKAIDYALDIMIVKNKHVEQ